VPLSEDELRLLEQMERALVEEDPKFASTLRGTTLRSSARRRAIVAAVCFVLGIVVLMAGAVAELYPVAIGGFVVMLVSATVAVTSLRSRRQAEQHPGTPTSQGFTVIQGGRAGRSRRQRGSSSEGFLDKMEARWRRRRENGGF
jgi:hypothetical protein